MSAVSDVTEGGISATGGVDVRCGHDVWAGGESPVTFRVYVYIVLAPDIDCTRLSLYVVMFAV